MWKEGIVTVNGREVKYLCKQFAEPSECGINKGKISKLSLEQNGKMVYYFERELVTAPQTEEAVKALDYLMNKYN